MFKTIALSTLLLIPHMASAFVSFDSAVGAASMLSGGLDSGIDLLESSSDLMGEISDESSDSGQFSVDMKSYNQGLKKVEQDMRYLGYSQNDISSNLSSLNSNKMTLEQKMKALTKSVKNIKKMKVFISKLISMAALKGGSGPDPSNQAMLANQQQMLHLQIQQLKNNELNELKQKTSEIAFKKSIAYELDLAKVDLINSKEAVSKKNNLMKSNSESLFNMNNIQTKAIKMSLCLCVLGFVGLMIGFFKEEGLATLKVGFLGIILSYLLPSIINLYGKWLGI